MKKLFLFAVLMCTFSLLFAAGNPDDILGIWQAGKGKGHIQIFKENGKYYGKLVWLTNPKDVNGKPKLDKNNPNASLQTKPLLGLTMLKDFKYDEGEWSGGQVYNPSDGKEYKAYIKLKDQNTLDLRGYVGISLFGKTDTWIRVR
jgi:uncharacterized protein (DUF2147 family)